MTDRIDKNFLARCFGLAGRTAVVTGAGSGLGRQAAKTLAAAGADVALLGRREQQLKETEAEILGAGGCARSFPVDVTDQNALARVLDQIEREMAPLWALVNNAGVGGRSPLAEVSEAAVDRILGVNTKAALFVATAIARRLTAARIPGRIINICSLAAQSNPAGLGIYGASKAALEYLTRTMAHEWAAHGINVNAVSPGFIETDINRTMLQTSAGKAMIERLPRKRVGTPDALDGAILLLASPASAFITGSTLLVDDAQRFGAA
ncbi:SDR family NAD(P)-dependent oxidoreductase [Bradyrhizobium acaciae]|uniref:SDR family NAD(P)-dependent oxidoreductase n=1 Tax=Bradyrhizobium acaciae TaxID=2683706 RepID=UPI001E6005AE|nr:SDR family NAD(P)-dependent oxidoreductase [Bradyrhizobium acaciae]MCC8980931.1 SDR family oxidoreductase [Bradyrhizobium acaciae]